MALTDNLVAFWELEEATGATRNDSHGTNHLADHGSVVQAAGKVGNCADFEAGATSQYLDIADNPALSGLDADFTACAWVNLESIPASITTIFGKMGDPNHEWDLNVLSDGKLEFRVSDVAPAGYEFVDTTSFGALTPGTWYFVAAWNDSTADKIYIQINDGAIDNVDHPDGTYDSGSHFQIGGYSDFASWFDGKIDQVGFWKRKLTSDEITFLYNGGNGRSFAEISASDTGKLFKRTYRARPFGPGIAR